jgi:hypothetical protein
MRTTQLTRADIQAVLLDGFFPECTAHAYPYRTQAALKEWGLPYASDCAVTRHLAHFLRGRPRVDAILFNGGSFRPEFLRQRICQLIGKWQAGFTPLALENANPGLAVARGAALFGKFVHHQTERIEAGAAHAVFLEVVRARSPEITECRLSVFFLAGRRRSSGSRSPVSPSNCTRIASRASGLITLLARTEAKQATLLIGMRQTFTLFRRWKRSLQPQTLTLA